MKHSATTAVLALVCAALAACGPSEVKSPASGSFLDRPDGGASDLPPPQPVLDPVPARVPWMVLPLRGRALRAHRIVIEEGGRTITERVLPDGTFCVDAPLADDRPHSFVVWAQSADGDFSLQAATADAVYDATASRPPGASLCDGSDPSRCTGTELCGNGIDDDCNGRVDALDPVCSACPPDVLEPNGGPDVPRIEPGVYEGLEICEGDRDFHPVFARSGQEIVVNVRFSHADGDIDARLIDVAHDRTLVDSNSSTDDETLRHSATQDGLYAIEIYGFGGDANTYTLEVEVR